MLSHITPEGQPGMVDVGAKSITHRTAHARAVVTLPESLTAQLADGEIRGKKGPVFQTAIIAGVMAAKRTSELIPLCHPIGLDDCKIEIHLNERGDAVIDCRTSVHHKTGVEMEAMTGATVAALTIYDMCKAVSHGIVIKEIHLVEKRGGKSDYQLRQD
ncbi:MAG: cyclic pyranopterin monophosphate synthase MoaC [Candidatus Hydrogenedentes bacterium]|nr:cyclic pyranopterin monophosphate synthase MoaC [Candidatus Hydrogenedentota bacterium]